MIVSHKYRFIFLKTTKTGGTSVEVALSKYCGGDDIITPIFPKDENMRRQLGFQGPQNFNLPFTFSASGLFNLIRYARRRKRLCFFNHMTAEQVKPFLPKDVWKNYFKFTIERNPWDRVVSLYFWRFPREEISFSEFLKLPHHLDDLKRTGVYLYSIDGKTAVDRVYRYEDLQGAIGDVAKRVGLPEIPLLPHAKRRPCKAERHYSSMYTEKEVELVREKFKDEIERHGYTYDKINATV